VTDTQKLEAMRLLLGDNNNVLILDQPKRKETRKETYNRLYKQVNEYEALRTIKKNLR